MSKKINELISSLMKLPSVGEKTASRYAYALVNDQEAISELIQRLSMAQTIVKCTNCQRLSDEELCEICLDNARKSSPLIVVEGSRDIDKIENIFPGMYQFHVLGGVVDPLIGMNIENLSFNKLFERIGTGTFKELMLVLPATNEGELTSTYIKRKLANVDIKISKLAQGIPIGSSLEYLDEITLLRSIEGRQNF
ncbi:MAG: recombination mediator RecR [Mycoplasmatales bacterium]